MNLKDLATLLGLSPTTVSRALNGYPEVSEQTRARVSEAAAKHGYVPDPRARSLATGRAKAVGLVIPVDSRHERVNPVFGDFVAGASDMLWARGYDIMLTLTSDANEADSYRMLAARSRVDGLVIQAPLIHDWRIGVLRELGLPYVVHGRFSDEDQTYSWVDMDNRRAFRRATEHLLDLGHSRIALLNGIRGMDFAERRADGFLQALRARGLEPPPAYFCNSRMTETYGYEAATTLLRSEMPPTALITSSVIVAMGVRRAIEAQGLRMGRDLSVVTHDDVLTYLLNDGAPPVFTAIRSPVRDAAERAIENLLTLIEDPSAGPIQTLLEAELVPGGSSGPAPTNPPQGRTRDAYQI